MSDVTQPSLFSAETLPPEVAELGGLLAAHGQFVASASGARLSILLADTWRAQGLAAECTTRAVGSEIAAGPAGEARESAVLFRTDRTSTLLGVAAAWTRGAVKSVPDPVAATEGFLRVWLIAAGRVGAAGYLLGLDPHAPDTHAALQAACARVGLAGALVGLAATPALRLTGRKRLLRLRDMVGEPPAGAPRGAWPLHG